MKAQNAFILIVYQLIAKIADKFLLNILNNFGFILDKF